MAPLKDKTPESVSMRIENRRFKDECLEHKVECITLLVGWLLLTSLGKETHHPIVLEVLSLISFRPRARHLNFLEDNFSPFS